MDREVFDALTRMLAAAPSRRTALGALIGAGLAGSLGETVARKGRHRRRGSGKKGKAQVSAQATCATPGPSSNLSGCNFNDEDFSGDDLSGSKMVATTFRDATLVGTNLSSSNMKQADFRRANLCGANLRSSTLKDADFRNANLANANLTSSACGGANFNNATFCNTRVCNGTVRNDACPGGPGDICCQECGLGAECQQGACVCDDVACAALDGTCDGGRCDCGQNCPVLESCDDNPNCFPGVPVEGGGCTCLQGNLSCGALPTCTNTSDCDEGEICGGCCPDGPRCVPACGAAPLTAALRRGGGPLVSGR